MTDYSGASHSGASSSGFAERLFGAARNNPEGILLLAAGCALLMRRGSSSRPAPFYAPGQPDAPAKTGFSQASSETSQQAWEVAGNVRDAASSYVTNASEYAENVKDAAGSYVTAASQYAADTGRAVARRSGELAHQAQESALGTFNRLVQGQPWLVVGIGLGFGAAVAAVFPATELEKRSLRPVGEKLSDAAATAAERLKTAATAASEQLIGAADGRGLIAEGLKGVAHQAADTFGKAFAGDEPGASKPDKGEGASGIQGNSGASEPAARTEQSQPGNPDPIRQRRPAKFQS